MTSKMAGATEKSGRRRFDGDRIFVIVVSLLMGGVLLGLGVPRTVAAWATIDGDRVFDQMWTSKPPSDPELQTGASALGRAIEWSPSSPRLVHLAMIELMQAQHLPLLDNERARLLGSAEEHGTQGLSADPVDGFGWLVVANARRLSGATPRRIASAIMQSLDMAPNMQWLWISRAQLLFLYSSWLNEDELLSFRGQLRTIWANPTLRKPLITAATESMAAQRLIWALSEDPEAMAEYERLRAAMISESPAK